MNRKRQKNVALGNARWAAYATAGAAAALGCASTAEGEIHYSGLIHSAFQRAGILQRNFRLENGAELIFRQMESDIEYTE
jgi:hypothetical protein